MFSVNIDKLIASSDEQQQAYKELGSTIISRGNRYKTIAILGENGYAIRLAAAMADAGKKVLFVDADLTTPVFMGKYRLGKNLEGLCEYIDNDKDINKIICLTNKNDFKIIFSGEASRETFSEGEENKFKRFLEDAQHDFDYVILEAGESVEIARNCYASIVLMDADEYSTDTARKLVEKYDDAGCLVLGVTIINA